MAATSTIMPNDAGKMNTIPSVPRPGEGLDPATGITDANASKGTLAGAAGEGADIPRTCKDIGATGEVETGTGQVGQFSSYELHTLFIMQIAHSIFLKSFS